MFKIIISSVALVVCAVSFGAHADDLKYQELLDRVTKLETRVAVSPSTWVCTGLCYTRPQPFPTLGTAKIIVGLGKDQDSAFGNMKRRCSENIALDFSLSNSVDIKREPFGSADDIRNYCQPATLN